MVSGLARGPLGGNQMPKGVEIASFKNYDQAVGAVSRLGQEDFDMEGVSIVGSGLFLVEKVMGKVTPGQVALSGAGQGFAWGIMMVLMMMILQPSVAFYWAAACLLIGVCLGMLLSVGSWALSRNKRQFAARSQIMASRYAVLVSTEVDRAFQILQGAPGNLGPGGNAGSGPLRSPRSSGGPAAHPGEGVGGFAGPGTGASGGYGPTVGGSIGGADSNGGAGAPAAGGQTGGPSEFGTNPDEQPTFGVRLTPEQREARRRRREEVD